MMTSIINKDIPLSMGKFYRRQVRSLLKGTAKVLAPYIAEENPVTQEDIDSLMDYSEIACNLDVSEVARLVELDADEIAERLSDNTDWDSIVSDNINEDRLADNIDYELLAKTIFQNEELTSDLNDGIKKEISKQFILFIERVLASNKILEDSNVS